MKKYLPLLSNNPLFDGINNDDLLSILHCINASVISRKKDSCVLKAGENTDEMGIVISGSVLIVQEGLWGYRNILAKYHSGDTFGEGFAGVPGAVLSISVVAEEDCEILLINIKRLLVTCPTACRHHMKLIRNLVNVMAIKNLIFTEKITHISKRTTREKLLSYLSSESRRQASLSFDIPFDRQQLADFLSVDRAAMCVELSKLQKERLITTTKNHFQLLVEDADLPQIADNAE